MAFSFKDWDPMLPKEETPTRECIKRIKRDLKFLCDEPPYGIHAVPDDTNLTIVHALITGASETPYELGYFYFILRCPPDYPLHPPKVKLMTTGGGQVMFNPNLYNTGKVCLSILGTWNGPCWSDKQTLSSVLTTIQGILTDKPYHNEPGYEVEKSPGDVDRHNEIILHETIRVAVCGMIDNEFGLTIPSILMEVMEKSFLKHYKYYEGVAQKKAGLTGRPMQDPFLENKRKFEYKNILSRLQSIRARLTSKPAAPEKTSD